MAQKPTDKPNWIPNDTSGIIPPGTSKQTAGWFKEERPPYQFFNWFWNRVCQWIDYFAGEAEYNIIIDTDTDEGDYTTLAAYIADSPAAGDRVLVKVDEEITGGAIVIPANISLKLQKGKKFWSDENLTTVLQFGNGIVTESDLLLELSHTGTVTTAVSFNGDDNNHANIIVKNTSTGTVTNAFKIESAKKGNLAKGEVLNPSGTVTNILTNGSVDTSNDVVIRESGGIMVNTKHSRMATINLDDSPAPDADGGGILWAEFRIAGFPPLTLDNSIDWRDRFITINGFALQAASAFVYIPGGSNDDVIDAYTDPNSTSAATVLTNSLVGFHYTETGSDGTANPRLVIPVENSPQDLILYADSTTGALTARLTGAISGNDVNVNVKIDYSPKQNHY